MNDKINILFAFDKVFFYMFSDVLLNFLKHFNLKDKENDDNFVYFCGYVDDIKKCIDNFLEIVNPIQDKLIYINSCYVLYTSENKVNDFETFYDIFNYCFINKNYGNIIEIEQVIDSYQKYCYIVKHLNKILDNPSYILFYKQNIYKPDNEWKNFDIEGMEILLRVKINDSILQPSEFFPVIEKIPLLFEKFELISFDNILQLLKNYNDNKVIHFNFTPNFIINFHNLFYKIPKDKRNLFVIEINERTPGSIINFDLKALVNVIKELNKHKFRIVFDDFGEGLNNIELFLSTYKHLEGIKIGMKIFNNLFTNKRYSKNKNYVVREEIEESVFLIKLFESLQQLSDMAIYYEGIDNQQKLKILSNINVFKKCYLQGFYFHKPEELLIKV